jgi:hypothetical protein
MEKGVGGGGISEAQKPINYIEENLKKKFENNKFNVLDQVFNIDDI